MKDMQFINRTWWYNPLRHAPGQVCMDGCGFQWDTAVRSWGREQRRKKHHRSHQMDTLFHWCFRWWAHNTSIRFISSMWLPRSAPLYFPSSCSQCCHCCYWLGAQAASLLWIQSHRLAYSAAVERALLSCHWTCPWAPMMTVEAVSETCGSQDSFSVTSTLILAHLYSTTRQGTGSSGTPFP